MKPRRDKLPARRPAFTQAIAWHDHRYTITVGFDAAGFPREVFADGNKSGSELEALIDDACILISIMLQSGWRGAQLRGRVSREHGAIAAGGAPASILGRILDLIAEAEGAGDD